MGERPLDLTGRLLRLTVAGVIAAATAVATAGGAGAAPRAAAADGPGKIAYTSLTEEYGQGEQITVVDMATLTRTVLPTPDGYDSAEAPDISPDGSQIVFTAVKDYAAELWVMNIDGTGAHRITAFWDGRYNPRDEPAWMPDGTHVVFPAYDSQAGVNKLFEVGVAGGAAPEPLPVDGDVSTVDNLSVAPDGTIAYVTSPASSGYDVWLREPDGERHLLVRSARDPAFSADGSKIYLAKGGEADQIYSATRDGVLTQVTTDPHTHGAPAPSPDDQAVAYRKVSDCPRVYVLRAGVETRVSGETECMSGLSIDWR
ncbi:hypothetical protein GCM10027176_68150 [Actinoallomurus bryophytorum]|uniref:WD40 repeat protein n=1 Tax=Actinoallomurus bryophytorum TaxID=1490222 RepID=A0A543CTT1_9ACTN|nr:PD40 domain-containing protein [Actinoallomurus bryophytorum]TQM00513.1 WD40 repeat protein [Actinoallomurus bryophytorum]